MIRLTPKRHLDVFSSLSGCVFGALTTLVTTSHNRAAIGRPRAHFLSLVPHLAGGSPADKPPKHRPPPVRFAPAEKPTTDRAALHGKAGQNGRRTPSPSTSPRIETSRLVWKRWWVFGPILLGTTLAILLAGPIENQNFFFDAKGGEVPDHRPPTFVEARHAETLRKLTMRSLWLDVSGLDRCVAQSPWRERRLWARRVRSTASVRSRVFSTARRGSHAGPAIVYPLAARWRASVTLIRSTTTRLRLALQILHTFVVWLNPRIADSPSQTLSHSGQRPLAHSLRLGLLQYEDVDFKSLPGKYPGGGTKRTRHTPAEAARCSAAFVDSILPDLRAVTHTDPAKAVEYLEGFRLGNFRAADRALGRSVPFLLSPFFRRPGCCAGDAAPGLAVSFVAALCVLAHVNNGAPWGMSCFFSSYLGRLAGLLWPHCTWIALRRCQFCSNVGA